MRFRWQWLVLTLVLVGISLVAVQRSRRTGLPEIAIVPAFRLTDQRGQPFGAHELAGHVWIANFMFTSCPDICPVLTERMVALRSRLAPRGGALRYVSFSVDPETDTPEVLARYARKHGADHEDWSFLTGELGAVRRVVVEGFKQAMEPLLSADKPANVLHGSHFVLVDAKGVIRGYYPSDTDGAREIADAVSLLLSRRES